MREQFVVLLCYNLACDKCSYASTLILAIFVKYYLSVKFPPNPIFRGSFMLDFHCNPLRRTARNSQIAFTKLRYVYRGIRNDKVSIRMQKLNERHCASRTSAQIPLKHALNIRSTHCRTQLTELSHRGGDLNRQITSKFAKNF